MKQPTENFQHILSFLNRRELQVVSLTNREFYLNANVFLKPNKIKHALLKFSDILSNENDLTPYQQALIYYTNYLMRNGHKQLVYNYLQNRLVYHYHDKRINTISNNQVCFSLLNKHFKLAGLFNSPLLSADCLLSFHGTYTDILRSMLSNKQSTIVLLSIKYLYENNVISIKAIWELAKRYLTGLIENANNYSITSPFFSIKGFINPNHNFFVTDLNDFIDKSSNKELLERFEEVIAYTDYLRNEADLLTHLYIIHDIVEYKLDEQEVTILNQYMETLFPPRNQNPLPPFLGTKNGTICLLDAPLQSIIKDIEFKFSAEVDKARAIADETLKSWYQEDYDPHLSAGCTIL